MNKRIINTRLRNSKIIFRIIIWFKPCRIFNETIWMIDKFKVTHNFYKDEGGTFGFMVGTILKGD